MGHSATQMNNSGFRTGGSDTDRLPLVLMPGIDMHQSLLEVLGTFQVTVECMHKTFNMASQVPGSRSVPCWTVWLGDRIMYVVGGIYAANSSLCRACLWAVVLLQAVCPIHASTFYIHLLSGKTVLFSTSRFFVGHIARSWCCFCVPYSLSLSFSARTANLPS